MAQKTVIIGGVAGGGSAAARLRRIDEDGEIVVLERGPYISFANCGLPYYIGGAIKEESKLLLQTPEAMKKRFNVDVRVNSEALSIDRKAKTVRVKDLKTGSEYDEKYDKLILSPGAEAFVPPVEGTGLPGVFTLRNVPDMRAIAEYIDKKGAKKAIVAGGGFIGVEMAENLCERGMEVTVLEMANQVLTPLDADMAALVQNHMRSHGVGLLLNTPLKSIKEAEGGSLKVQAGENSVNTDLLILCIGVRPDIKLAKAAGLEIGTRGGIKVDGAQRTSDPDIYAVGDAAETTDALFGGNTLLSLAGPANRQGRLAADGIGGMDETFPGVFGTSILKIFDLAAGSTGKNEKQLAKEGVEYKKVYIHPMSHAGYYPGGTPMTLKLIFSPKTRKVLGAQAVGANGVDKRIDVIATAIQMGAMVDDLAKLELSYAPPFSSAKDPVNMSGFVACNMLDGLTDIIHWDEIAGLDPEKTMVLDVRTPQEHELGNIVGSQLIPVDELRGRLSELPKDKEIEVYCKVGIRGYIAERILKANGFKARNLSGGFDLYRAMMENENAGNTRPFDAPGQAQGGRIGPAESLPAKADAVIDASGLQCPGPIMKLAEGMKGLSDGQVLSIKVSDPAFDKDVEAWCARTGNELLSRDIKPDVSEYTLRKGAAPVQRQESARPHDKTIIVFSGDLDKAIASFIIANGAVAMGRKVTMFFTFWGLNILRRPEKVRVKKDFIGRMFGAMMPRGSFKLKLSRMSMMGIGGRMIRSIMKRNNIDSLEELIKNAMDSGVRVIACSMSAELMGIKREELMDGVEIGGVASFLDSAEESDASLFI